MLTVFLLEAVAENSLLGRSQVHAETRLIPSLTVSERYDTNIFNAAPQFIPPGTKKWDFATTASPQVRLISREREVQSDLTAGVSGNSFVNNPELSYVTTNASLRSNLDKLVSQLIPGAKLEISDYFLYTPQPPAFLTGVQTSQGVPDIYSRGLQVARANSTSNTAKAAGTYALTPAVSLGGEYLYSFYSIGTVFVSQGTGGATPSSGLSTKTQAWSVGPSLRLSKGDTLSFKYNNAQTSFSGGGVPDSSFTAHGIEAGYTGVIGDWSVTLGGGGTLIEPGSLIYPTGKLALTAKLDPATTATVGFSRTIAPSLLGTLGALISNTTSVSVQHSLEKGLRMTGTVNYAFNESAPAKDVTYKTLVSQLQLSYPLSRIVTTSLTYDYSHFTFDSTTPGAATSFLVGKSAVTLAFGFTWN